MSEAKLIHENTSQSPIGRWRRFGTEEKYRRRAMQCAAVAACFLLWSVVLLVIEGTWELLSLGALVGIVLAMWGTHLMKLRTLAELLSASVREAVPYVERVQRLQWLWRGVFVVALVCLHLYGRAFSTSREWEATSWLGVCITIGIVLLARVGDGTRVTLLRRRFDRVKPPSAENLPEMPRVQFGLARLMFCVTLASVAAAIGTHGMRNYHDKMAQQALEQRWLQIKIEVSNIGFSQASDQQLLFNLPLDNLASEFRREFPFQISRKDLAGESGLWIAAKSISLDDLVVVRFRQSRIEQITHFGPWLQGAFDFDGEIYFFNALRFWPISATYSSTQVQRIPDVALVKVPANLVIPDLQTKTRPEDFAKTQNWTDPKLTQEDHPEARIEFWVLENTPHQRIPVIDLTHTEELLKAPQITGQ